MDLQAITPGRIQNHRHTFGFWMPISLLDPAPSYSYFLSDILLHVKLLIIRSVALRQNAIGTLCLYIILQLLVLASSIGMIGK